MKLWRLMSHCCWLPVPCQAQVTYGPYAACEHEPQNWLTYSGGYSSQRYSLLDKINRDNVKSLQLKWVYPSTPWTRWKLHRWL